ncbi:MAG: DUF5916 domain-containing protein [Flavisolibacter sp.]
MNKVVIALFVAFLYPNIYLCAQQSDTCLATQVSEKITLDGRLSETIWKLAPSVNNFTQRELNYGQPASEKTKVSIVYDNTALYLGIWCYMKQPKEIRAKFMQRDFDYDQDDVFGIAISTFNDKRNGYLFVINPNGARADLLISGIEEGNKDWNAVWDCKTTITNEGWFAEVKIPFSSLQFRKDSSQTWNINFERDIRSKNEQVLWQGWTRDCSIFCLANAGTLTGLQNIGYVKRFELKPYTLGSWEKKENAGIKYTAKLGGDLNVNLTPTLKLNLTSNTDFAQVEADRIAVNLSRFNLFYPEKREFFLEGYQNFQFSLGNDNQLFYTRRIGIENFQSVPIIAGARLFGKVGRNNIGVLNIQTGSNEFASATNNSVIRYKRDIGTQQSYIGGIFTSKFNKDISNKVAGIDGAYSTSRFMKNKNLIIAAVVAESFDKSLPARNNYSWRFYIDYPNDLVDHFIGISGVGQNFNPSLGFLKRSNFQSFTWNMRYYPRWFTKYGIRRMSLKPWEFTVYRTATTGELESLSNESRLLGFFTKSGEIFEYNFQQFYDRVDQPFHLTDSVSVPIGKYWMYRQELQAASFQGRKLWTEIVYGWGGFYSGRIKSLEVSMGINANKHLNFRTDYTNNHILLDGNTVITNELAEYINYAFNPKLDLAFFVQWNSLDDFLLGNFRLHWIPKLGSDLYVVYNRGYNRLESFRFGDPNISSGAAKLIWRIVF